MGLISKLAKKVTKEVAEEASEKAAKKKIKKESLKIKKKKKERTEAQKKSDSSFGRRQKKKVDSEMKKYYHDKYPDKKERMELFGRRFEDEDVGSYNDKFKTTSKYLKKNKKKKDLCLPIKKSIARELKEYTENLLTGVVLQNVLPLE